MKREGDDMSAMAHEDRTANSDAQETTNNNYNISGCSCLQTNPNAWRQMMQESVRESKPHEAAKAMKLNSMKNESRLPWKIYFF